MVEQIILEHVLPDESKWSSSAVVLRKPKSDLRIWGYYKIGVNHKIYLDFYPIPNIENILHLVAGNQIIYVN